MDGPKEITKVICDYCKFYKRVSIIDTGDSYYEYHCVKSNKMIDYSWDSPIKEIVTPEWCPFLEKKNK